MKIVIPKNAAKIIELLKSNTHDAYIVGGCVRDFILERIPGDWDITTSAKPKDIKRVFRRTVDTGIEHGTVTVLMGDESYEVTTYRIDGDYSDRRHPDKVTFTEDLKEDLRRRDFTINAMAYNDEAGLVDIFGGMDDLNKKIIRCVGNADERFDEDALRILRAIRFASQLDFDIDEDTFKAIKKHASELEAVSAERILVEINKMLTADYPEKIEMLWECGLEKYICEGFKKISKKDAQRLADAVADSNKKLSNKKHIRWAKLAEGLSPEDIGGILLNLKSDNDLIKKTVTLTEEIKNPVPRTEEEIRRCLNRIGPELFDDLCELKGENHELKDAIIERGDAYNLKMLAVTGGDLIKLGFETGPKIGEILDNMLDKVIKDPSANDKAGLLSEIDTYRQ